MADRYTSQMALVLDAPVDDVQALIKSVGSRGDLDRAQSLKGEAETAAEVHWGGRMQKAVVRALDEPQPMLRAETYIGGDGLVSGLRRQAQLLLGFSRVLGAKVRGVRDLSSRTERDHAWLARVGAGAVEQADGIDVVAEGEDRWWVHTHGAARFDIPDLELYGLAKEQVEPSKKALAHVHTQMLNHGKLKAALTLPGESPVYLVPVLEAWKHLSLDWLGVGKAGVDRGDGLDGPRATLSLLHKPRLGRYKTDLAGVLHQLTT